MQNVMPNLGFGAFRLEGDTLKQSIHAACEAVSMLGKAEIFTNQIEVPSFLQNRKLGDHCKQYGIRATALR